MNKISGTTDLYSALLCGMLSVLPNEAKAQSDTLPQQIFPSSYTSHTDNGRYIDNVVLESDISQTQAETGRFEYSITAYEDSAGYLIINTKGEKSFEMKIDVGIRIEKPIPLPLIGPFLQKAWNIGLSEIVRYKIDILFSKPDDQTYIEKVNDETFTYHLRNDKWVFVNYDGGNHPRSEKEALIDSVLNGVPALDFIVRKYSGEDIPYGSLGAFIEAIDYKIVFTNGRTNLGVEKLVFDLINSENKEYGIWKSLAKDKGVIFGGDTEIRLIGGIIFSAEVDINHNIFPTTLRIKLNL